MPETASRRFNVRVADDEPDVRGLLVGYLRERDHTTTAVPEGRAAVQEIEQQHASRYTLIISDLQLPGVDGLGVLRAAHDYLTKPFSLSQIDVIVRRLPERQTLEAENRHPAQKLRSREADETRGDRDRDRGG